MTYFWFCQPCPFHKKSWNMRGQPFLSQMTSSPFGVSLWLWLHPLLIRWHSHHGCRRIAGLVYAFLHFALWYVGSLSHWCSSTWMLPLMNHSAPFSILILLPLMNHTTYLSPRVGHRLWFFQFISLHPFICHSISLQHWLQKWGYLWFPTQFIGHHMPWWMNLKFERNRLRNLGEE